MNSPATPQAALRTMRTIAIALCASIVLLALLAWVTNLGSPPLAAGGPWMFYVWIAFAGSLAAASMVLWRGSVVPLLDRPASDRDWRERASRIQTGLILCWSLVAAAALFGVVVFWRDGIAIAAWLGLAMIFGAVALTWPREDWLATGNRI